jgi:hypothetical protein
VVRGWRGGGVELDEDSLKAGGKDILVSRPAKSSLYWSLSGSLVGRRGQISANKWRAPPPDILIEKYILPSTEVTHCSE